LSRYEERLLNHSLRETMTALREALDGVPEEAVQAADESGRDGAVERAGAMLDHIDGLLAVAAPELVTQATLDAIHTHVDQALSAVRELPNDPASYSANLDQAVENSLQQAVPLATATAAFAESAQKLGRKSGGFTRTLKKLEGEKEMIAEELAELEARRKSGLEEMTAEQEARRSELTERIDEVKSALEAQQEQVNNLTANYTEQLDEAVRELKDKGAAVNDQLVTDAEEARAGFNERAKGALAEIIGIRDKIGELYTIVTDTVTAGAFHDEAAAEKKEADRWRWIAIGFGTAAAVIAVAAVALAALIDISSELIFAKIAATVAGGVIATYAGKQSAHHRSRADQAKDLELELVACEGFMHSLEDNEQRDLRENYFDRAFQGRGAPGAGERPQEVDAGSFGITPEVLSIVTAVVRAMQADSK
jgi:predicted  nucleic acid-binding Zn-ribbon protein